MGMQNGTSYMYLNKFTLIHIDIFISQWLCSYVFLFLKGLLAKHIREVNATITVWQPSTYLSKVLMKIVDGQLLHDTCQSTYSNVLEIFFPDESYVKERTVTPTTTSWVGIHLHAVVPAHQFPDFVVCTYVDSPCHPLTIQVQTVQPTNS